MARTSAKGLDLLFAQEVPSGSRNGSNTSFSLANTPYSQNSLMLFVDAVPQLAGTDFTLSGTTITMTVAPSAGQSLLASYLRKS